MRALRLIRKIILNLFIVPLSFGIVAALITGYITQSDNQAETNYAIRQENITRLRGDKIVGAPLADPSFDAVSIIFLAAFLVTLVFMILYMISGRKKKNLPQ